MLGTIYIVYVLRRNWFEEESNQTFMVIISTITNESVGSEDRNTDKPVYTSENLLSII